TVTVTPAVGHQVVSVAGDTTTPADNADGTWTAQAITADCAITATFAVNSYTVTASASGNGTVTPASQGVDHGDTATFTVTPDAGHHVDTIGGTCPAGTLTGTGYQTGAITGDCSVTVAFAQNAPGSVVIDSGDAQSTPAGSAFAAPLSVRVTDAGGVALSGVTVAFSAEPGPDGAAAVLSAASATTDGSGMASITATANAIAGPHAVRASVTGVGAPVLFALENLRLPAVVALSSDTPMPGHEGGPVTLGGTVDFLLDGVVVCAAVPVVDAVATCDMDLPRGRHQVAAQYDGGASHTPAAAGLGLGAAAPVPVDARWAMVLLAGLLAAAGLCG